MIFIHGRLRDRACSRDHASSDRGCGQPSGSFQRMLSPIGCMLSSDASSDGSLSIWGSGHSVALSSPPAGRALGSGLSTLKA
eukprot:scaffold1006_cov408-Prasinococcus_capsulatus_cf.AAC.3